MTPYVIHSHDGSFMSSIKTHKSIIEVEKLENRGGSLQETNLVHTAQRRL